MMRSQLAAPGLFKTVAAAFGGGARRCQFPLIFQRTHRMGQAPLAAAAAAPCGRAALVHTEREKMSASSHWRPDNLNPTLCKGTDRVRGAIDCG
jgi:hypothetical protein